MKFPLRIVEGGQWCNGDVPIADANGRIVCMVSGHNEARKFAKAIVRKFNSQLNYTSDDYAMTAVVHVVIVARPAAAMLWRRVRGSAFEECCARVKHKVTQ